MSELLNASSRVALAAYLHDLGKFAERARIPVEKEQYALHEQMYCRRNNGKNGGFFYSHKHAAFTALAFDLLEEYMPALKGTDFTPFGSIKSTTQADDSLINASAMHHKPENFMQWIVATADRAASGFERAEFDRYNDAEEGTDTGKNHYQARMLSLFEQIRLENPVSITPNSLKFRYPLLALSPNAIFPQLREKCEPSDNEKAQEEYGYLWHQFMEGIKKIPISHQQQLPLWLDHFDSLWLTFTHCIPSATAFGSRPDVSLYDHSKTTASLATALWRYHADNHHDEIMAAKAMSDRTDWDEQKFLLIQGDFYGVQDFIFANGAETNKKAAKILRGRSFYVSLLTEAASLRILEALDLPSTSQITNAAGKFLIVAPNTDEVKAKIEVLKSEFNQWFLKETYGRGGIGIATEPASCNDFVSKHENKGFKALMARLFAQLEAAKFCQFNLCGSETKSAVFTGYLESFDKTLGVCQIDQYSPAVKTNNDALKLSVLASDQMLLGEHLTKCQRLLISSEQLSTSLYSLKVSIFGYWIHLTDSEEETGKFGPSAKNGVLRRAFDFSLPTDADTILWNGYSRRNINGYVSVFTAHDQQYNEKYKDTDAIHIGDLKTLNHIACEDRLLKPDSHDQWQGISAIGTLKGDVDNLGSIFQKGLEVPTFAKMASLSRQMNNFFAVYLPSLCNKEFHNTYTVFAGGDDFFLIGPWRSQIQLANTLRKAFAKYCAMNPELHFSAGISISKPGLPVSYLGRNGEHALDAAKSFNDKTLGSKNAVSVFGESVHWSQMDDLLQACKVLEEQADKYNLSTAYIYALLNMVNMVEDSSKPENSMWRSQLTYKTWRTLQQKQKGKSREQILSDQQNLMKVLGAQGLEKWRGNYRVVIQTYLYQYR